MSTKERPQTNVGQELTRHYDDILSLFRADWVEKHHLVMSAESE